MFPESDFIPISALTHFVYCPRRCALVHLEQQWAENRYTAEGKVLHERADSGQASQQKGIRVVRTLPICSRQLGLSGQADVVEFHADGLIYPVEYKRGKPKKDRCDEVQLCAQALCLEEMLDVQIDSGALFYGKQRRRKEIFLDAELRALTKEIIDKTHQMIIGGKTPQAVYDKKCDACSLLSLCLPKSCGKSRSVSRYMNRMLGEGL